MWKRIMKGVSKPQSNRAKSGTDIVTDTHSGGKMAVFRMLMLNAALWGSESANTFAQLYMLPILQTLGMPLAVATVSGLFSGPTTALLLPTLGKLIDRGATPLRRKTAALIVAAGTLMTSITCVLVAEVIHLTKLKDFQGRISNESSTNGSMDASIKEEAMSDEISFAAYLAVAAFVLLEVCFDSTNSFTRSFVLACSPVCEHKSLLVVGVIMVSSGGFVSSLAGILDLTSLPGLSGIDGDGLVLHSFLHGVISLSFIVIGLVITLMTGRIERKKTIMISAKPSSENDEAVASTSKDNKNQATQIQTNNTKVNVANCSERKDNQCVIAPSVDSTDNEDELGEMETDSTWLIRNTHQRRSYTNTSKSPRHNIESPKGDESTKTSNLNAHTEVMDDRKKTLKLPKTKLSTEDTPLLLDIDVNKEEEVEDVDKSGGKGFKEPFRNGEITYESIPRHQNSDSSRSSTALRENEDHSAYRDFNTSPSNFKRSVKLKIFLICVSSSLTVASAVLFSTASSDYVGKAILGGKPDAEPGSEDIIRYKEGTKMVSKGLCVYYGSYLLFNLVHSRILNRLGYRAEFLLVQLLMTSSMVAQALTARLEVFFILSVVAGVHRTTFQVIPYAAVIHIVRTEDPEGKQVGFSMSIVTASIPMGYTIFCCMGFLEHFTGLVSMPMWMGACCAVLSAIAFFCVGDLN